MTAPYEYAEIDSLRLNGTGLPWWCDFDISTVPVWGTRTTKGDPSIPVPHTDGDLPATVHRGPITFTLLGSVYGDYDQDGDKVTGGQACRLQLQENLEVLMDLIGGGRTFSYVLGTTTFTGTVTVQDVKSAASPKDPPVVQRTTIKIHLPSGILVPSGS